MIRTAIHKRTLGVNFSPDGRADIAVWAPLKEHISVVANGGIIPLEKNEWGFWKGTTSDMKPGDFYNLLVDNRKELPDPVSLSQPQGVHGPSQALDVGQFLWTDTNWKNPPLEEYIFYELHTGTFTAEGNFASIEGKLDYLMSLGINAIEIMPVAQFPGNRNWGYDGVFLFAVQHSYGGAKGLCHLVNACHERGIAVVLDIVYNHLGPEGNYVGEFAPYFTEKYRTPWGNGINYDDGYCDGVRQFFIENALMWLRDFHIDALRLDAVHTINDCSPTHILREIQLHIDELSGNTGRVYHLIVEVDLNDNRFINPPLCGGYGMDAQWNDDFHHALRVTSGQERTGYYTDFSGVDQLAKAYRDAYVFDGQYSHYRKKIFGVKTDNPGRQFIVFSQNHDQVGNRMFGERASVLVSFEMQKLLAAAVLVSPFLPLLFMGEEYGETNPFLYFVSHADKELAEAVCKGRKAEFAGFYVQGEAPDPGAEETFLRSKLQWDLLEQEPHQTLFRYYRTLLRLRRKNAVLSQPNRGNLEVEADEKKNCLWLARWNNDAKLLCLMNFSRTVQEIPALQTSSSWKKIFDSATPKWHGPAAAKEEVNTGETIVLQPESMVIYTTTDTTNFSQVQ